MTCRIDMLIVTTALVSVLGTPTVNAADKPAALIIAQGGMGDESYNDLAFAGFQRALKETGLEGKPVESKDVVAQAADILRRASDADFGLVVDLEYAHGEPMLEVAKDYPDTTFAILNQVQKGDNIVSVLFQEQEGSYLAGVLAAQVTTDTSIKGINAEPIIGVIGGTKSAGIDKFIAGYIEGAKSVNPKIDVKVAYSNNFADPALGQQMAKAMFEEGVDIIYQVAGGTGTGVIQAAKDTGHFAIGVDGDQDGVAPGNVLTSMIKKTDVAVEDVVKNYAKDVKLGGTTVAYGLKEDGVGLSDMKYTKDIIPAAYLAKVEAAKAEIISGKVKVWNVVEQGYPDYLK
ncbi:BMP family lipoprotein [Agrobacterium rubi]|uniref:BMP family ABC transporter substrate-binding protein n=1 Tax=Agrobacterium rubi TaxID=28099 RepID=A0AAE7R6V7_9HYPH|nr:BMP family ABC transporter substrate-binding protein [Agrobacterium rubi]NTE88373.1 BMP family ABC transporter substrate-binding protein [Agrobacterium rubi]NTF04139.1 BMP family ABC transporter substrate-binding protein [Agrobacterium rubi]NTF38470.1 BMP family ABC transporter substrate-binding protein [Agrobacterium rubi]QTG02279.1 BMP family ABC transporter substrate-binding protein [Agrobacterium rubi]